MKRLLPILAVLGALSALAIPSAGCAHEYGVENRLTPVHVWLSAPALAREGRSVHALVYVGTAKVVEGPVRFQPGVSTVVFPTVHVNAGRRLVQAVLANGTVTASETVSVDGETWVHLTLQEGALRIASDDEQPLLPR